MKGYPLVAPSVLSLNFSRLDSELERMKEAGVSLLHYDVMDGHFTPWISFGEHLFKFFTHRGFQTDVHLMVNDPLTHVQNFINLGADQVTVHLEALDDPFAFLRGIKDYRNGRIIGLALNPDTPLDERVWAILPQFDKVMVMSVVPGRSGQSFIEGSDERIHQIKEYIRDNNLNLLVEVAGGINARTGPVCVRAGADLLVSGAYLCMADDPRRALEDILGE